MENFKKLLSSNKNVVQIGDNDFIYGVSASIRFYPNYFELKIGKIKQRGAYSISNICKIVQGFNCIS